MRQLIGLSLAASLAALSIVPAHAEQGRKGSLATGLAIGAAAGIIGSKLLNNNEPADPAPVGVIAPRRAPVVQEVEEEEEETPCRVGPVRLFTQDGTYVKTERLQVCR